MSPPRSDPAPRSSNALLLAGYGLFSSVVAAASFAWAAMRCARAWSGAAPPPPPAVLALALIAGFAAPGFACLAWSARARRVARPFAAVDEEKCHEEA